MVSGKFKHVAMKRIGARFGGEASRAARLVSVLRVLRAGFNLELLHGVRERQYQVVAVVYVVVQGSVEQVGDAERLTTGDGDASRLRQAAARRIARVHGGADGDDERRHVTAFH